jgi:hypothetical protein
MRRIVVMDATRICLKFGRFTVPVAQKPHPAFHLLLRRGKFSNRQHTAFLFCAAATIC